MIRELQLSDSCCYGDQVSEMYLFCSVLSSLSLFLPRISAFLLKYTLCCFDLSWKDVPSVWAEELERVEKVVR